VQDFTTQISGLNAIVEEIPENEIKLILKQLGISIVKQEEDTLLLQVPHKSFRYIKRKLLI
jgi:hypothetical protein